jgi:hypothetical protein
MKKNCVVEPPQPAHRQKAEGMTNRSVFVSVPMLLWFSRKQHISVLGVFQMKNHYQEHSKKINKINDAQKKTVIKVFLIFHPRNQKILFSSKTNERNKKNEKSGHVTERTRLELSFPKLFRLSRLDEN